MACKIEILLIIGLFGSFARGAIEDKITFYAEETKKEKQKRRQVIKNTRDSALRKMKSSTEKLNFEPDDYFVYEIHRETNGKRIPYRKLNLTNVRRSLNTDQDFQLKKAMTQMPGARTELAISKVNEDGGVRSQHNERILFETLPRITTKEIKTIIRPRDISQSFRTIIRNNFKRQAEGKAIKKIIIN